MVVAARIAHLQRLAHLGHLTHINLVAQGPRCRIRVIQESHPDAALPVHRHFIAALLAHIGHHAANCIAVDRGHRFSSGRSEVRIYLDSLAPSAALDSVSPYPQDGNGGDRDDSMGSGEGDDEQQDHDGQGGSDNCGSARGLPKGNSAVAPPDPPMSPASKRPRTRSSRASLAELGVQLSSEEDEPSEELPTVPAFSEVVFAGLPGNTTSTRHVKQVSFATEPGVMESPIPVSVADLESLPIIDSELTAFAEGCYAQYLTTHHLRFNYPFRYIMHSKARELILLFQFAMKELHRSLLGDEAGKLLLDHIHECGQHFPAVERMMLWSWLGKRVVASLQNAAH